MKLIKCPYKSISGSACHHRYAEKSSRRIERCKTICKYIKNPNECQLYKLWLEQRDKQKS